MLKIKQELLAGLAAELEKLSPGTAARAAFESPKVAAHGDFAVTAAMQLAKPLKLNPRQLGEMLRAALLGLPAYERWVADIDIAGPGFLNIRLKPEAKQQIVHEVLEAGVRFGMQPSNGQRLMVEFVSANPTGLQHLLHDLLLGRGREADVDEAGAGDVDVGHPALVNRQGQQRRLELFTHLARVELERLGQLHRCGDGVVAMRSHFGGFEGGLVAGTGRELVQRLGEAGQQFLFDLEHRDGILGSGPPT